MAQIALHHPTPESPERRALPGAVQLAGAGHRQRARVLAAVALRGLGPEFLVSGVAAGFGR